jgi:hypothetical protein
MPQRESRCYQAEWSDYDDRKAKGCAGLFIVIPVFAVIVYLVRSYQEFGKYLFVALFVIGGVYFLATLGRNSGFKCPRCGSNFDPSRRMMSARYCTNCELPIYYGSARFYEYWGPTYGRNLAEKIGDKEK